MTNNLQQLLAQIFRVSTDSISNNTTMDDIPGWDSLTHMDLIVALEQQYNFVLDGDEIADLKSIQAIDDIINKKSKG